MKRRILAVMLALAAMLSGILQTACDRGTPADTEKPGDIVKIDIADPKAKNLMDGIETEKKDGMTPDDRFKDAMLSFSSEILRRAYSAEKGKNTLVSPLSIELALAMTANGAAGVTKDEMMSVISGGMSTEELNAYFLEYVRNLPSDEKSKLSVANSIWFRDDESLKVKEEFLKTNAGYYGAEIYEAPFDNSTVDDVNGWVKKNTDGMIEKILDSIGRDSVMYLINALAFDSEWADKFNEYDIRQGEFTEYGGKTAETDMMNGTVFAYMSDGDTEGFLKHYAGYDYAFAAFLPDEGVDFDEYVKNLTSDKIKGLLSDVRSEKTYIKIPKFEFDYEIGLADTLKAMGMETAFDISRADFRDIGTSDDGNIYIGQVLHKTYISVDGLGTRAGAVTVVEMLAGSAYMPEDPHEVYLDRPFVFAIVDCETMLPVFIGTLTTLD